MEYRNERTSCVPRTHTEHPIRQLTAIFTQVARLVSLQMNANICEVRGIDFVLEILLEHAKTGTPVE